MTLRVRELPPLRLGVRATAPNGRSHTWRPTSPHPEDVPQGLSQSSTIPGGHEACGCKLARKSGVDYSDLVPLTEFTVFGAGGDIAWQGRLERTPRASGNDLSISPAAVGHQAELDDNKTVRIVYVDIDLSRWGAASVQRKINQDPFGRMVSDGGVTPDATTGEPAVELTFADTWDADHRPQPEAWYDAGPGDGIGSVYYALKTLADYTGDPHFAAVRLDSDDHPADGTEDDSGNLISASPVTGTIAATTKRRFAHVEFSFGDLGGADGAQFSAFFTALGVFGPHGLTKRGAGTATDAPGLFDTDIIGHAIGRFTTLRTTRAGESTIVASPFVVPQAAFTDPTTVTEIVRQANRFSLNDWAVWDDRTFWLYGRGAGPSKRWRARVGPAQLSETGPQVDRLWESICVQFTDTSGATRTVGPPGSGADFEDAALNDSDPYNPATLAGKTRRDLLVEGTDTPAGAIELGRRFLEYSKELDTSGAASLVGHVLDDRGVMHPAWRVRAGDYISFVDAHDPSYRRVVRAGYDDGSKTCSVDLDSPPEAMAALLERLSASLVPIGLT